MPWPSTSEKSYDLLQSFLAKGKHTMGSAFFEFNIGVISARVSELRERGWPINGYDKPHPLLKNEQCKFYSMDTHFLHWWQTKTGSIKSPWDYPSDEGRGKFTREWHGNLTASAAE